MRVATQITLCTCIAITHSLAAQVNEHFSDGDFIANPAWAGDTVKFDIAAYELWLHAPAVTDAASLTTPSLAIENTEWQVYNRMDFNPSSSNFCRFYLVSDQRNLSAPAINGYYVELGRVTDEISLYKVVNGTSTRIIDGPDNMLNAAACTTRVKVTRTGNLWELMADTTGGTNFISLGSFLDASITETYFTGVWCKYTSTRSDKFFFDDVLATGTPWADLIPPSITSHIASNNVLMIRLNEPILTTDLTLLNFTLDNGLSVLSVTEDSLDSKTLYIAASGNFQHDIMYHLQVSALHDLAGNTVNSISYPFILHTAAHGEVVINEIMADPNPQVNLPDAEYIELRNNSIYPIDLQQWNLQVGGTQKTLPVYTMDPGAIVMVADVNDTALFDHHIQKIGIAAFPGLNNGGTEIALLDTGGIDIDHVYYDMGWYHDPVKEEGGYSLERINPAEFCMQADNWHASTSINGGTPGTENSVYDSAFADIDAEIYWIDSIHLLLVFNQWMDPVGLNTSSFTLQNLVNVQVVSTDSCILVLSSPLPVNTLFNLTISTVLMDCYDNHLSAPLVLPVVNYTPTLFDVLIDELMIDEEPAIALPLAEYIEIYNSRPFPVNINGWKLVVNGDVYVLDDYLVPADSFIILTHETHAALFTGLNVGGIPSFGGLTNDMGIVELYHANGMLLHAVKYHLDYYDVNGKADGGWALEMIDLTKPCMRDMNWTASQDPAGGTPGKNNSYHITVDDPIRPHALKTGWISADTAMVYFDEGILPDSFTPADVGVINGAPAVNITYHSPLLDEYKIAMAGPINMDSIAYMQLHDIADCEGNLLIVDSLPYSHPVFPDNFDVVINEVLADPTSNCIDYVEIYNRGQHAVDLSKMIIGEGDTSTYIVSNFSPVHIQSVLLHPGEYLYISENHEQIMSCYTTPDSTSYWDVVYLPDYTNTSGTVGISTYNQQWIDMFAYNDNMQLSTLNSTDGVSLERLDINAATQDPMNWHSAASTVGFGTPGYKNSQFSPDVLISNDFAIEPEVFSPDNDGYKDYVTIYYQLANVGYAANLKIFDQAGRMEKYLVNNEMLGTSGHFVWDGTDDKGGKVNVGIHIIYFELTGSDGKIIQFKKPVVVGAKL